MANPSATAAKARWNAKNYDQLVTRLPKGMRDRFRAACEKREVSQNAVVREAVEKFIAETEND